jgi:hypothetical protein
MRKLTSVYAFSGLLICVGLTSADGLSAELEGALQYPPLSWRGRSASTTGEDAPAIRCATAH